MAALPREQKEDTRTVVRMMMLTVKKDEFFLVMDTQFHVTTSINDFVFHLPCEFSHVPEKYVNSPTSPAPNFLPQPSCHGTVVFASSSSRHRRPHYIQRCVRPDDHGVVVVVMFSKNDWASSVAQHMTMMMPPCPERERGTMRRRPMSRFSSGP